MKGDVNVTGDRCDSRSTTDNSAVLQNYVQDLWSAPAIREYRQAIAPIANTAILPPIEFDDLNENVQSRAFSTSNLQNIMVEINVSDEPVNKDLQHRVLNFGSVQELYKCNQNHYAPNELIAEHFSDKAPVHRNAGEYVTVKTEHGKHKIPSGEPEFGVPTNFKQYSDNVNGYVKWIESYDTGLDFKHMTKKEQDYFANAMRHALGIAYLVFQGMPGDFAVQAALEHEKGDTSLDSRQDRNNNIWAARMADKFAASGKTWQDFVAYSIEASVDAVKHHNGFLVKSH